MSYLTPIYPGHGPGQYAVETTGHRRVVVLRCPTCGDPQRLPEHTAEIDGRLQPMVTCNRCFWEANVKLIDWEP